MGDAFQAASRGFVAEYEFAQRGAVQLAIDLKDFRPEGFPDFCECGCAWRHHVSRDLVGIQYRNAERAELMLHGGFSTGDAASQSNAERHIRPRA